MIVAEPERIGRIRFAPAMLEALLKGRKNQTRRLLRSSAARSQPGDWLWVQEPVRILNTATPVCRIVEVQYGEGGPVRSVPWPPQIASPSAGARVDRFMPRELSRLTLVVTAVRVERLQALTFQDARAEGCLTIEGFASHWDALGGDGWDCGWASNPEVAVIGFELRRHSVGEIMPMYGSGGVR